jgi:putative ABC transport system ATP-binding protein
LANFFSRILADKNQRTPVNRPGHIREAELPAGDPAAPILSCSDLEYRADSLTIVQGLNLQIECCERVALTGPSGSGKSTILRLLANLITPTKGSVYFQGTELSKIPPVLYRREVSYFFQTARLFGRTVRDNLAFPYEIRHLDFDEARALKLLERCGIAADSLNQPIGSLSGGERQRVALVRNLQFTPKVLLLDEITSALDQENREIIWQFLNELTIENNLTLLMVSHQEADIELADRVIEVCPPPGKGSIKNNGAVT